MSGSLEQLRAALRRIARTASPREIARVSGISYSTIYRLIGEGEVKRPNRATVEQLEQFVTLWQKGEVSVREESAAPYSPGPAVAQLPPRARATVVGYLNRLEAAGLAGEELLQMEHLLADPSFAQRFSTSRGGPLSEDDWILLIESTWRAIADTLALRGVRP